MKVKARSDVQEEAEADTGRAAVRVKKDDADTGSAASSSSSCSTSSRTSAEPAVVAHADAKMTTTTATTTTTDKKRQQRQPSSSRYASIDVLRALSQTQMILVHFVDFWSGGKWQHMYYEYEIMDVVMWLLLSGVSFHITSTATINKSRSLHGDADDNASRLGLQDVRRQAVRRGIFFILMHLFVTVIVIQDTIHAFMCDTLVLMGIAQVVLGVVCQFNTSAVLALGVSILVLTGPVQYDWFWSGYWRFDGQGEYNHNIHLERYDWYDRVELTFDMILCNGIFPIFPYLGYPLIGLGIGRLLYPVPSKENKNKQQQQQQQQEKSTEKETTTLSSDESVQKYMKYILRIGLGLVTMSASLIILGKMYPSIVKASHEWRWLMLDGYGMELGASFEYIWGSLGKDLVWVVIAKKVFDTTVVADDEKMAGTTFSNAKEKFVQLASQMSKTSLTMYLLHHIVIFMVIRGLEWWEGEDFDEYHGDVFAENPMYSIYIGLTFFVVSQYLLCWMDRKKIPMVESLLRWFCKATTFSSSASARPIKEAKKKIQ